MTTKNRRHLISISNLSKHELNEIISRSVSFAEGKSSPENILKGLVIGIYFRKTSTRTRTSFSSAALRMGANIISYGPNDLQENTGESILDTQRVLSRMLDGLVARTAGSREEMRILADQNRMSVINAMNEYEHPTQAIADITTMKQHFGDLAGLRIIYVGEGNNTASALALSISRFSKTELTICTPDGYGLDKATMDESESYANSCGARIQQIHDLSKAPSAIDIVYTTRWQTTGTSKADPNWRLKFEHLRVDENLMTRYPNAIFMHDLPAHRGEEVEASVLDGAKSIAFDQAENKLHSAKAVLEWCLNP
jgi:ornithine carbamoyltransferase